MRRYLIILILASACSISLSADGFLSEYYENFSEGSWKFEVGSSRIGQGEQLIENPDDTLLVSNFDYEWPLEGNTSLSLRIVPMLFYHIDEEKFDNREDVNIYAMGAGLAYKIYEKPQQKGLYLDFSACPIWNSANFPANSSNINFLLNIGLGYEFDNGWSTAVKYYHISNASLGDRNRGVDTFTLSLGYRF